MLYVIDSLRAGGAEAVLSNLVTEIVRNHPDCSVQVAVLYEEGHFAPALKALGVPVVDLHSPRVPTPGVIRRLRRVVREGRFDIVHAHLFPADVVTRLAVRRAAIWPAMIFTEHGIWNRRRKVPGGRWFDRWLYSGFDRIIGVSRAVCASLAGWIPSLRERIEFIPNGVPVGDRLPERSHNSVPQLLFVGRMHPVKGLDVLLRALPMVKEAYHLRVVGDGSLLAEMQTLSRALGLAQRVEFLGRRSDVLALMQQADCLVVPSRWEGLPMVVLEAMSVGCPVVATPVGGIPEVIGDGITGWLVPLEDPTALAQKLAAVLSDGEERTRVAQAAFARVRDEYAIEQAALRHIRCYERLIGQPVRSGP